MKDLGVLFLLIAGPMVSVACSVPARTLDLNDPVTVAVQEGIRAGKASFSYRGFDALLKAHVKASGRVDYRGMSADRDALSKVLDDLAEVDLAMLSRSELLAFLINTYNAYTVDLIVRNYPIESIKKIDSPWETPICRIGGATISLNTIEHKLLRPKELFDDPRMHFAINCASIGCPLLRAEAYTGARVDEQLDGSVRNCLQDSRYVTVDGDQVMVSKILSWFKGDFVDKHGSLSEFLKKYCSPEARAVLEERGDAAIGFLDYDWNLNDTATASP